MLYIFVETKFNSGIDTWNNMFIKLLTKYNINSTLINVTEWKEEYENISNSILIFNNVKDTKIFNTDLMKKWNENKNKLYFVIHGDICPVNKAFVAFNSYFHGVISVSKKVKSIIHKHFPNKRVIYLPNKIERSIKHRILKNKDNEIINFGYVGRLSKEKNLPLLIRAYQNYRHVNTLCHLHLFGSIMNEKYTKYIKDMIKRLELSDYITIHGHVNNLDEIYETIDILILPSISEGIPYCIIEASYYGLPLVVADVGCINEIMSEKNGELFKLDGYPSIKNIYINKYEYLLLRTGYVSYINGNGKDVTDTKLHICKGKICKYVKSKTAIVPAIDCSIYNSSCQACMELLQKKMIFQKNINNLTNAIQRVVDNYEKYDVEPIYFADNMEIHLEKLLDKKIGKGNIKEDENYDVYYPFETNDNYDFIIDTNESYGKFFMIQMRALPHIISIEYELLGECYLFISNKVEMFPNKVYDLDNSGKFTVQFRPTSTGYHKIGLRFKDTITGGKIKVKSLKVNMLRTPVPYGHPFDISRWCLKNIDAYRYEKSPSQSFDNMLFMFLICRKEQYLERLNKLMKFLDTFQHKYILIESDLNISTDKIVYYGETRILKLPIAESYENIPHKVITAYKWVYDNMPNIEYIYKLDDDFGPNVMKFIPNNYQDYDYYGNFIVTVLISAWHFGKCNKDELNNREYNKPFIHPYGGGGYGYIINRKSLGILIDNQNEIKNDLYEDKAIGDILFKNNIKINTPNSSGKLNINSNIIYTIESKDYKVYIISISNNEELSQLIFIMKDNELIYQRYFTNLTTVLIRTNSLSAKIDEKTINLVNIPLGKVVCSEESINNKDCTIRNDINKIIYINKIKDNFYLLKQYGIRKSKIILKDINKKDNDRYYVHLTKRSYFHPIYIFKWAILKNKYIDMDSKSVKTTNHNIIPYSMINNYDYVIL